MARRRVVVTGMGVVTSLGHDVDSFFKALVAGKSGVGPWTLFDSTAYKVHFGGEVPNWKPEQFLDVRLARRLDRFAQFALVAAIAAVKDAGIETVPTGGNATETVVTLPKEDPFRTGVILGSGIGGLNEYEEQHTKLLQTNPSRVSPFVIPKLMSNAAPGQVSIYHGLRGPNMAISTACASAANAIGEAFRKIQYDEADLLVTGGSEAAMTTMGLSGFIQARALSERNDAPQKASRPWDKDRDGFVLGEGAGILVIEELEHAKKRGAKIHAEIAGYGTTADAHNITAPCPDGSGAAAAMRMALKDGGLNPTDIDYVNAHGTSTPLGDIAETLAVKTVFGDHAKKLAVNSTKSMIGHSLGASGGIETIVCIKSLLHGILHPTINLDNQDPECDLDYVPNQARERRLRAALSNSFGFGGHNAVIVVKPFVG